MVAVKSVSFKIILTSTDFKQYLMMKENSTSNYKTDAWL